MNALKKMIEPKKCDLELLAGGGAIERAPRRPLLSVIFKFLFGSRSDLTLEAWQELERKRGIAKIETTPLREQHYLSKWHI